MTVAFFASAALLCVIAVLLVVPAMMRKPARQGGERERSNVEVARQRLDELEQRARARQVSEADADQQRQEIERQLLDDIGEAETRSSSAEAKPQARKNLVGVVSVAALVPLVAGLLYVALGKPSAINLAPQAQSFAVDENATPDQVIEQLQAFLQSNPDNQVAWLTLAQTLAAERQFALAADAYAMLRGLSGDSANLLAHEADARAMAQGGGFAGEPQRLIELALTLEPENTLVLSLAGIAAFARQDYAEAISKWQQAESNAEDPEARATLREAIANARERFAQSAPQAAAAGSLRISVSISDEALEGVEPDDAVFVLARAVDGPSMPLAVVKRQVRDLPLELVFDDSFAMTPQNKLSDHERVVVVARVSRTGTARASSGDPYGQSEAVDVAADSAVEVVISEITP